MSSDVAVRELRDDDVVAVQALLRAEWPDVDWPRRFARLWRDNPTAAADTSSDLARGFVHEHDGALHGFFGSIPVRYQLAGRPGIACIATALCVAVAARARGVATALVAAFDAQPAASKINATANAASAPLFERLGYTRLDPASGRHVLAHAKQPFGAIRKAWRSRASGAWRTLVRELRTPRVPSAPVLACSRLDTATAEIDALWQTHRGAHPTTLCRDRGMLQWLLFADSRCTVIGCRDRSGALRGYGAFQKDRGELRQIDLFPAHDDDVASSLALGGAALAASRGIATVRLLSVPPSAAHTLESHGFEPVADDLAIQARGIDPHGAWLTRLDGDSWL